MSGIFATIEEAVEEIRAGRVIIVTDDEARENEGDFVMAAERVTPEAVNFMTIYGRGLVCQSITAERARELALGPMAADNTSVHTTAFTVSVDARGVTTTGISAFDRAATIKTVIDPAAGPDDLLRPGHIFPLVAKDGGVLSRDGHTEASLDLARLAGLSPSGVLCEIIADDGTMARLPRLQEIAREHGLKIVTVAALIRWRAERERASGVTRITEGWLPSASGDFRLVLYENPRNSGQPHIAMVSLKEFDRSSALVRVHSECLTGEVLMSARCDCGAQLSESLRRTGREGGVVIYLRQEGRGIGLAEKIRAYNLQDEGCDTVDANIKLGHEPDERDYGVAAAILRDLGITGIRLMTNNPDKEHALKDAGIEVHERVPIEIRPGEKNRAYLATKKVRLGHDLKYV
ncbi:MAG: bifunctional 3,4-dihydroxy-2-butanone-4-phosphate synthase/GTP cyclohydrolase II [Treponemataceae bacterium]|nr:MAG: bifunctional 3,4-dihydroxy-2-butanone-4-phosphate synthase/GTP cyclohydrolase II [Treponemataceae bacterium]GMO52984.1 MAG: bifunctional 3,4-dihydroxy-2-butanone-4-phosphate synthase/GTP cyclohydrolase II [Treponemataceae bacterium]